jgi:hypothetical protein
MKNKKELQRIEKDNEVGPDFEELVGTETPIHNPHDAFRCKCPMCVEWRNNPR